ncbi:uncharacterized protein LOC109856633 isoform X2 [Pseudomyrmex gracilis]|uniref:uncharacterized protein LOC109856633 isoform X2 n=1 Tax=Pseudomyrmex gracilis TaxID=219809 RepID=UPI00099538FD|nr:uncharacterized protein LOC109856633 isoform X2 [Pseudomyrmex gracilis]
MPFYRFNSLTGRLKSSTHFQPLYPLKAEPVVIYDTPKTKPLTVTSSASYSTDLEKPPTLDPKLWAKYKHFQSVIDKPVYLAGGKSDKILFGFTVAYLAVCTAQTVVFVLRDCLNVI